MSKNTQKKKQQPLIYGIHSEANILGRKKKIRGRDKKLQDRYNKLKY